MCEQQIKFRVDIDGCDFKKRWQSHCVDRGPKSQHMDGAKPQHNSQGALPSHLPGDMCHIYTRGKATV